MMLNNVMTMILGCYLACFNIAAELSTASSLNDINQPIVYKVSDDRIVIKPRLKYELIISLHVLKYAEDHHELFIP
jgi:hypothetical protein